MALASEYDDTHEPCDRDNGALPSVDIVFDLCEFILRQAHDEDTRFRLLYLEERPVSGVGQNLLEGFEEG